MIVINRNVCSLARLLWSGTVTLDTRTERRVSTGLSADERGLREHVDHVRLHYLVVTPPDLCRGDEPHRLLLGEDPVSASPEAVRLAAWRALRARIIHDLMAEADYARQGLEVRDPIDLPALAASLPRQVPWTDDALAAYKYCHD
jgi:hypothetical protein